MDKIKKKSICILARNENLKWVHKFIEDVMSDNELNITNEIELAIEEIFLNITNYAYNGKRKIGSVTIQIGIGKEPPFVMVTFIDNGVPFNPKEVPKPNIDLPLKERAIGGLGIFLVEQIMDSVTYCYKDNKNILTLFKEL